MKKTLFALMTIILMPTVFAKAALDESRDSSLAVNTHAVKNTDASAKVKPQILDLAKKERAAYIRLNNAQHEALVCGVSSDQLEAISREYDLAKEKLEEALSKLSNRAKIEAQLIELLAQNRMANN
jgi:hypothetical protein